LNVHSLVQREGVAVDVELYAKHDVAKKIASKTTHSEKNRDCERRERDAQTDQKGNDLLLT
jgi:hypothetical protein